MTTRECPQHAADDPGGVAGNVKVRATGTVVADVNGNLDDGEAGANREQEDFGFEGIASASPVELQGAGDGIATQAALGVGQVDGGEAGEEVVGDAVGHLVGARGSGAGQVADAEDEGLGRRLVAGETKSFLGRVLTVRVYRHGDGEASVPRQAKPCPERSPLALVAIVADHGRSLTASAVRGVVQGPVVHDEDPLVVRPAPHDRTHHIAHGGGGFVGRHDDGGAQRRVRHAHCSSSSPVGTILPSFSSYFEGHFASTWVASNTPSEPREPSAVTFTSASGRSCKESGMTHWG